VSRASSVSSSSLGIVRADKPSYCVGTRRKAVIDQKDIDKCRLILGSDHATNFESRMVAEVHLYYIIYISCAAPVDLPKAQETLHAWKEEWGFLLSMKSARSTISRTNTSSRSTPVAVRPDGVLFCPIVGVRSVSEVWFSRRARVFAIGNGSPININHQSSDEHDGRADTASYRPYIPHDQLCCGHSVPTPSQPRRTALHIARPPRTGRTHTLLGNMVTRHRPSMPCCTHYGRCCCCIPQETTS
jgi:hypothetical protein